MGVAGLWPELKDASTTRSLVALALDSIDTAHKGYRLGIDASIWFVHSDYGKEGENPQLRTLFFRCAALLRAPILPIFIFDGPKRPKFKRGKRICRADHKLTTGMKAIIEAYGFQHRQAPGEAEAELAYLNRMGLIDGVMTDDVDTFLFGANTVVRNPSSTHAHANADTKKAFVVVYKDIPLSPADLILMAICSGGDYNEEGLPKCGISIAHGLAKSGLSDTLYTAATELSSDELDNFLVSWRAQVVKELATNASGKLPNKRPALARSVPPSFPDKTILLSYTHPVTSFSEGKADFYHDISRDWTRKEPSLPALAATCEFYFEWGFRDAIVKRSRSFLWPGVAFRILRRYLIDQRGETVPQAFGTCAEVNEQNTFMRKIHGSRTHHSTDNTLEYRVEIDPCALVKLVESGVKGLRREDDPEWAAEDSEGEEAKTADPYSLLRVWLPASLVRKACPDITEEYDEMERKKAEKKNKPKGRKKKPVLEELSGDDEHMPKTKRLMKTSRAKKTTTAESENEILSSHQPKTYTVDNLLSHFPCTKKTTSSAPKQTSSSTQPTRNWSSSTLGETTPLSPVSPSKVLVALNSLNMTKKPPAPAPTTPKRIAKPFPLRFSPLTESEDDFDAPDGSDSDIEFVPLPPMTPSPAKIHSAQKNRQSSSNEETNIHKSPRRSRLDSPQSNRNAQRNKSPLSSCTKGVPRKKLSEDLDVIVISSDDDEPPKPVAKNVRVANNANFNPLQRARALAAK